MDMINDILERFDDSETNETSTQPPKAPSFPVGSATQSFPKASNSKFSSWRERKAAREKQQEQLKKGIDRSDGNLDNSSIAAALRKATEKAGARHRDFSESEKIHIGNLERLSRMSEKEIEQERNEILGSMDERVLKSLLKRAMAREQENDGVLDDEEVNRALGIDTSKSGAEDLPKESAKRSSKKSVSFDLEKDLKEEKQDRTYDTYEKKVQQDTEKRLSDFSIANVGVEGLINSNDERYPSFEDLQRIQTEMDAQDEEKKRLEKQREINVHFPKNPTGVVDDLDPSDPRFFDRLHEKYFPSLPSEPDKLEWMQPLSKLKDDDVEKEYSEERDSLLPRELRFDFKGEILSPRQSQKLPTHMGLHHHGLQPDSAGYTIPELAHLARSTVNSQRSIAIQTLGRILYRLGKGNYGAEIGAGLWGLLDEARVVESITEATDDRKTKSMTVRAYAVEALWLWRQGGGGRPAV